MYFIMSQNKLRFLHPRGETEEARLKKMIEYEKLES